MAEVFEFDLVFALPEGAAEDALLDALFEAGFDDAVVGLGTTGLLGLSLEREGEEAEAVIARTAAEVLRALPDGAELREVRPDLVSLADVAARLAVTRQALRKRPMPTPLAGGLYRASEVGRSLAAAPSGKAGAALEASRAWFAAAGGAQRVNARLALGEFPARTGN